MCPGLITPTKRHPGSQGGAGKRLRERLLSGESLKQLDRSSQTHERSFYSLDRDERGSNEDHMYWVPARSKGVGRLKPSQVLLSKSGRNVVLGPLRGGRGDIDRPWVLLSDEKRAGSK